MKIVFFYSSVVIKLFVPDAQSGEIQRIINETEDIACSFQLVEFQSSNNAETPGISVLCDYGRRVNCRISKKDRRMFY